MNIYGDTYYVHMTYMFTTHVDYEIHLMSCQVCVFSVFFRQLQTHTQEHACDMHMDSTTHITVNCITSQYSTSHPTTTHHITSQHIAAQHHITLEYIFCSLLTALVLSGATPLPHVGSVLITFTSHSGAARVAPESFILCEKERHL